MSKGTHVDGNAVYLTQIDAPYSAAAAAADGGLHRAVVDARTAIAAQLLLRPQVVLPDAASIIDPALRALGSDPEYSWFGLDKLFSDGSIAFARRSSVDSFGALDQSLREDRVFGGTSDSAHFDWLDFLDGTVTATRIYDYELAATAFSDGLAGALSDSDLVATLGLRAVAGDVRAYLERQGAETSDGFLRRSAAFHQARALEERLPKSASALRALSSAIYHAAPAGALGLEAAYSAPLLEAASAIAGVSLTALPELPNQAQEVPSGLGYAGAIDADVIQDVRSSKPFAEYLERMAALDGSSDTKRAAHDADVATKDYLAQIDEVLIVGKAGRFPEWQQLQTWARLSTRVNHFGVGAMIFSGAFFFPDLGVQTAVLELGWSFGAEGLDRWLKRRSSDEIAKARRMVGRANATNTAASSAVRQPSAGRR